MQLSTPAIMSMFGFSDPKPTAEATFKPGQYLQGILQLVAGLAKPKGQRRSIGPTHPLHGERAYEATCQHEYSKTVQFPIDETLPDGRHRYFIKDGLLVDRLNP